MTYDFELKPGFESGETVLIRRLQGGRPCRRQFIVLSAGLAGRDGCHYYHIRPAGGGRDQVIHQTELVRFSGKSSGGAIETGVGAAPGNLSRFLTQQQSSQPEISTCSGDPDNGFGVVV